MQMHKDKSNDKLNKSECHFCFDNGYCDITTCDRDIDGSNNSNNSYHRNSNNNIDNFDTSNNSSNNNQINSDLNDLNSQQTDKPYFNYLGGYLPDGTPKHVDLGNRRLLDRRNHVETNGTNFTDVENVFDYKVPYNNSIRKDKSGE